MSGVRSGEAVVGAGRVWRIADIGEATVALFMLAMPFTAPLAALRLFVAPTHNRKPHQRSPRPHSSNGPPRAEINPHRI